MNAIDNFLDELNSALETSKKRKSEIVREVREHLIDSTAHNISLGAPSERAEDEALEAFGSVDLIASGFNACEGAKATKQAPLIALSTGVLVFAAFLAAAWSQPRSASSAAIFQQITFFSSVIAVQVALVAGLSGTSRIFSIWRSLESSGKDRAFIRRATRISLVSLVVGVLTITSNLIFDSIYVKNSNKVALASSMVIMIAGSIAGFIKLSKLKINSEFEIQEAAFMQTPKAWTLGESVIGAIKNHPTVPLLCVAAVAGLTAMNKAETNTLQQALPWGVAEIAATTLGFYVLGPALGLRETRSDPAALS